MVSCAKIRGMLTTHITITLQLTQPGFVVHFQGIFREMSHSMLFFSFYLSAVLLISLITVTINRYIINSALGSYSLCF